MKKVLSLVLALVMVLGSFSFVSAAAPNDVVGTEYESAVDRLIQLGVLTGYPDGTFKPSNTITRAEFAAAAIRVKGYEAAANAAKGYSTEFKDVPGTHWASGYIGLASKLGLVKGMGDGTFAPEAPITYEQAVTLVMRAIGYEVAAEAKGGYPYGYLILASENGLLDAVKGTQGLPAPRGLVAQLLDNALEIPMMVQVGYGPAAKWVVSGSKEHDDDPIYLLDELGYSQVVGTVTVVDASKNSIKVGDKALKVADGFDFNFYEGLTIKAWYTGNNVSAFTVAGADAQYVSTVGGETIVLGSASKGTKVAENAYLELDGKVVKADDEKVYAFGADYAKVVLNKAGEIAWAKGYTVETLVVDEVEDDVVYSYNEELDVEKFTLILDGKTISADDIEAGDVLFYNYANKFAVVYNNSKVGEIDRVYENRTFRFEGKVYALANDAVYKDGKEYGPLTVDELAAMMDEEKDVEVFFNLANEVVLVIGNLGEEAVETSSYIGLVLGVYTKTTDRRGNDVYPVDILNNEGKVVEYNFKKDFKLEENTIVKVSLKDGDVDNVAAMNEKEIHKDGFKLNATYAKDNKSVAYRLQASTLIFYVDAKGNDKVVKLADAKFTGVSKGTIAVDNGRVYAVIADELIGEPAAKTQGYAGLVTNVRALRDGRLELTFADGKTYLTEAETVNDSFKHNVLEVEVSEKTGAITEITKVTDYEVVGLTKDSVNIAARTITDGDDVYELNSDAAIYDITGTSVKTLRIRDLKADQNVRIYFDGDSARFVSFVVVTTEKPAEGEEPDPEVVNKADLEAAIARVATLNEEDYTEATWAALVVAKNAAVVVVENKDATQAEVNAALKALNNAIAALVEVDEEEPQPETYTVAEIQADGVRGYLENTVFRISITTDNMFAKFTEEDVDTVFVANVDGVDYVLAYYPGEERFKSADIQGVAEAVIYASYVRVSTAQ